jgi:hypothetical protein
VFDTRTGERDSAKMAAARAALFSRLKQGYNADALLHIAVRIVSADFEKWTATWDGTHQTFENFGHRFKSALLHGQYKGRTRALSLFAGLENTNGQLLYDGRGGLQVYVMPKDGKFIDVPDSVFFADTARDATAVHLAVCQLVTRGGG